MIRNILFDMGGVLLRFDPELFVSRLHLDAADSAVLIREVFHSAEWVCLDRGSMTEDEAFASMCARIPERLGGNLTYAMHVHTFDALVPARVY